ncbi:MAG TPA: S46 family peptidase [Hellea balneolensis]|uniref:Dipeptidyl-peptidase n=1 Tax=Hellea balneolensis TaxID=287478 RepID=A0A7C5M074_9PROT|nr:S46 family peptidase [Hellea balneolensis]
MHKFLLTSAAISLISLPAHAVEGMFTPDQLPEISKDLKKTGLKLNPKTMTDLTAFPMGAVISLGGCTASFVSQQGLVVTNHHCARGSVQYNSTKENNYLENGFLAKTMAAELPAAPGSRIYVTTDVTNVTNKIKPAISEDGLSGEEIYARIDAVKKELIKTCEQSEGYRCQVASFYGGLEYKMIKRLEIRDVRLVYAPADSIGKYGGDIDNWMWPRHTGDFSFYRAYVAPDGKAADFSKDNVPYKPAHTLKVSAAGLGDGDFVMAAGYPGRTSRYARLAEVKNTFEWLYPSYETLLADWIKTIEETAPEGSEARIKYEARLAGLNNFMKNLSGQIDGARRVHLIERRAEREAKLNGWIGDKPSRAKFAEPIKKLDALAEESALKRRQSFYYNNATRPQLLGAAQQLYRLAIEKQKPDAERESGYQERDMAFFKQRLKRIDRRFDPKVDKAEWLMFLKTYMARPQNERVAAFDKALGLGKTFDPQVMNTKVDRYYTQTKLTSVDTRLALMEADVASLKASSDPFMQLAVALFDTEMALEKDTKDRAGRNALLRPEYMQAIINWQKSKGYTAYPDANSTLRVTYGNVVGGSPKDGLIYEPFTRLEGILEKDTGIDPFNAPKKQLELIRNKDYGKYKLRTIGSVPVNFLSDLDSTGGNSGSATMNAKGELVGLLFDGTFESVNSDWDFDPRTTRTIHLDTRYMLWVMEKLDGATNLIEEMDIVR